MQQPLSENPRKPLFHPPGHAAACTSAHSGGSKKGKHLFLKSWPHSMLVKGFSAHYDIEIWSIISPILQISKQRLTEIYQLAKGHIPEKKSQDVNSFKGEKELGWMKQGAHSREFGYMRHGCIYSLNKHFLNHLLNPGCWEYRGKQVTVLCILQTFLYPAPPQRRFPMVTISIHPSQHLLGSHLPGSGQKLGTERDKI